MISTRILSKTLQELSSICHTDFALLGRAGQPLFATSPELSVDPSAIDAFLQSAADEMTLADIFVYRISDRDRTEYILLAHGGDAGLFGRIASSEIHNLIEASGEKTDQSHFIQHLLLDDLLPLDIRNEARRLRIREDVPRVVFLIETDEEDNEMALQTLRALITAPRGSDFITPLDMAHIAVVKEFSSSSLAASALKTANTLSDMLNTEAMISVRVAYGEPVNSLTALSHSCKEAHLALEVGRIFYPDRRIISCDRLGIGRLIYQLPTALCERFLRETFPDGVFDELTEEDMATIRTFFANSLNISETARQLFIHRNTLVYRLEKLEKVTGLDIRKFDDAMTFKLAMMVSEYLHSQAG